MGFEDKGARCGRRTAPPSLEENYRRWLRSMRDRIDSELAGEERAVEWLRKTLPAAASGGGLHAAVPQARGRRGRPPLAAHPARRRDDDA